MSHVSIMFSHLFLPSKVASKLCSQKYIWNLICSGYVAISRRMIHKENHIWRISTCGLGTSSTPSGKLRGNHEIAKFITTSNIHLPRAKGSKELVLVLRRWSGTWEKIKEADEERNDNLHLAKYGNMSYAERRINKGKPAGGKCTCAKRAEAEDSWVTAIGSPGMGWAHLTKWWKLQWKRFVLVHCESWSNSMGNFGPNKGEWKGFWKSLSVSELC